jgi:hypothetical protein
MTNIIELSAGVARLIEILDSSIKKSEKSCRYVNSNGVRGLCIRIFVKELNTDAT